MELEGRFTSSEKLAEIMRSASVERLTGTLALRFGNASTEFQFLQGKLTGSTNPDRPRRLGQILLNRGVIDRAALEEALAYQADFSSGTPLGKILIHRDCITLDDLRDAMRLQMEEEIWDLLYYGEGFYQFKPEDSPEEEPLIEIDPTVVVAEIMSRREEWNIIRFEISNDHLIPAVVKLAHSSDRESTHLNQREWHILSLVNGYYDVGCIATRSGLGRFETYRILHSFLSSGLIELRPSQEPAPAQPANNLQKPGGTNGSDTESISSSSRWSGLLSRLREDTVESLPPEATTLQYDSPVSFLVEICNSLMAQLITNPDFVVDPSDERLAERYWRQVLMSYPRADLVTATQNTLTAESFDRYTRTLGVEGPMKSIFIETIDALNRYLHTLYLLSAQRLGSREARKLFLHVLEDMRQRSTIGNSESYFFKDTVAKVLD